MTAEHAINWYAGQSLYKGGDRRFGRARGFRLNISSAPESANTAGFCTKYADFQASKHVPDDHTVDEVIAVMKGN